MIEKPLRFAVIEDIPEHNNLFTRYLKNHWSDCVVKQLYDYPSAANAIDSSEFDVVVSDVMLGPGADRMGGVRIAKALDSKRTPLLIVSALKKSEIYSEVFEALGAWDYLEKPVVESDFLMQAELAVEYRRGQLQQTKLSGMQGGALVDPDLRIDFSSRIQVTWKMKRVHLTMTQTRIVEILSQSPNVPVRYEDMFAKIESGQNIENLRVHIMGIRIAFREVDPDFEKILSVTMFGYVWQI